MASTNLHILVAAFTDEDGAAGALNRLKASDIKRGNAAVISRGDGGKLHIKETHDWGMGRAALVGAVAAIFIPGIGPVLGGAAGAAAAKFTDFGFPDEQLKRLGQGLTPDSSALVLAVDDLHRTEAERVLRETGGQVVGGGLDANLADQLERSSGSNPQAGSPTRP